MLLLMPDRFIALGAEDVKTMLEETWIAIPVPQRTGGVLYAALQSNRRNAQLDSALQVQSQANNAHAATAFLPGADRPSSTELTRGWQRLVDLYRACNGFLTLCAQNGFDAFQVTNNGQWGNFLSAPLNPALILDPNGNWARLCLKYVVNPVLVVNQSVQNEYAVWLWMMESIFPVTETRADRRFFYLGQGGYIS
jgi:hypothetical protein